jgi:hypothetical protein
MIANLPPKKQKRPGNPGAFLFAALSLDPLSFPALFLLSLGFIF